MATIEGVGWIIPPMATERKTEPKLAEAAAKTTAALETLRSRLNKEAPVQEQGSPAPPELPDELGAQLEQYFAATSNVSPGSKTSKVASGSAELPISGEIRSQVIDGVVDRILRCWGAANDDIPADVKNEVIARLVEHVLGALLKKGAAPR